MIAVTIALFTRYFDIFPASHASEYAPQFGLVGKSVGGRDVISCGVSSEFTTVM